MYKFNCLFQKLEDENPQELLDTLPPLPEDKEEKFTPELKLGN